jgi:hypothetical protein
VGFGKITTTKKLIERKQMQNNNKINERISRLLEVWTSQAPDEEFGGYSIESFKAATLPSLDARKELRELRARIRAVVGRRMSSDRETRRILRRVLNAIRSSEKFGDDSEFYRALGFVPWSERRTGPALSNKTGTDAAVN